MLGSGVPEAKAEKVAEYPLSIDWSAGCWVTAKALLSVCWGSRAVSPVASG